MTETQWLSQRDNPLELIDFARGARCLWARRGKKAKTAPNCLSWSNWVRERASRRFRLLAVALCRRVLPRFPRRTSEAEVLLDLAERYAERDVEKANLASAWERFHWSSNPVIKAAAAACSADPHTAPRLAVLATAKAVGSPWPPNSKAAAAARRVEAGPQCDLVRCFFGNPFLEVRQVDPTCYSWNKGLVPLMANAIYQERCFDQLPVLADAAEEAGWDDANLLAHLRAPGRMIEGASRLT